MTDVHGAPSAQKSASITVSGGTVPPPGGGGLPGGTNRAPRADFRADPTAGAAPLVVTFSNRSTDPDGDVLTSVWDFGDGFRSTEASPRHTYASAGAFTTGHHDPPAPGRSPWCQRLCRRGRGRRLYVAESAPGEQPEKPQPV